MYFKRIEMTGFKSFADRTQVSLEPGITAVVGPNGCGKSNILDSIRWALGEQSAKTLRGSHMQDVIFNGSDERKPTGMAEVSLVFDNADSRLPVDFSEVQVTRRVYRSGESEYLINKAPCRLRDIQEMFMDTGIGTSAYSLIGQGKISMVLSSKPDDRRFLFEEAAGIIKYKARKRVAMRKLDSAEHNLLRLTDIIAEVDRQMRSLKRQVNAAIRHRELTDTLRELEIRGAWLKYTELSESVVQLREQFAQAQNTYEKQSAAVSKREARREEISLKQLEVDRVLSARKEGVYEIDAEMEKIERQIALSNQQIEFGHEQREQALAEKKQLEERASEIQEQRGQTDDRTSTLSTEIETCRETLAGKQQEQTRLQEQVAQADSELEALRQKAVTSMNERAQAQTQAETLGAGLSSVEAQLEEIYGRQGDCSERSEHLVAVLEEKQREETHLQEALAETETKRQALAVEVAEKAEEMAQANRKWQDLREEKSSVQARHRSLSELRDSYEGFAVGVRAIMMAKQRNTDNIEGIIGPAGDLLSTHKDYERAIEAALGGNINNIIVEDADCAKGAIQFLRKHKAGRVTFLPLDTIRPSQHDDYEAIKGKPGVIGPAIDQIDFDPHIHKAAQYLLHNTMIVETIDDAVHIARSERRFPRLVTLDGEVVSSTGAVTGGRTKHESRGLLGRSAEIDELEAKLKEMESHIGKLVNRERKLGDSVAALKEQMGHLATKENELRKGLNDLGVVITRHSTELDNLRQSTDSLNQQRDQLCARREELEAKRRDALQKVDTMQSDDETLQRRIEEAQDKAAGERQRLSEHTSALSDLRVKLAELNQNFEEAERDKNREQREYENTLAEAQRKLEVVERIDETEKELKEQIAVQVERIKSFSENKEEAHQKVVESQNQRAELLDEAETLDKELRELRDQGAASQKQVHQLELELRHNEDQLTFFQERILDEYNVTLSSLKADDVGTDELSEAERNKEIEETRAKLQRMGTVNLMAIEEYDALTERHDFLVAQEEDLRKAHESLMSVVARIDKTIREMFLDTFDRVADNFRQYFRRLFNGGQARIYLLDEDDPLESGIEIEARPPGKKPQSISLLSGGEQAMTAIALLFGIFKAKPSPFCVLDEVDAPLDDANIGRFLTLVEEFTDESQFIIITHSKQTMARANVLYGVTMQERGVSKLVSVKFDEAPPSDSAA